ncbi:MAG: hypothetical protein QM763_05670 [Agriterribacter sp.]
MGKPAGVKYHVATPLNHCDKCGMDNSGCCHDNIEVVKFDNVQNVVTATDFRLASIKPLLQEHAYFVAGLLHQHFSVDSKSYTNSHPPGINTQPRSVLYCVFRI